MDLVTIIKDMIPGVIKSKIRLLQKKFSLWPLLGWVNFGSLRRVNPISHVFGFDRGLCIDRYYIENFLLRYKNDIYGRVLEVAENTYTRRFGKERVKRSDVLYLNEGNPNATIVADLTSSIPLMPSDAFDCIILTQTLQFIYDIRAAMNTLYRILKPGGVLLATFPGISQISRYDMQRWGEYWRFTTLSAKCLFSEFFPLDNLQIKAYGNVLTSIAFLHGLAVEDLKKQILDYHDPDYEMLITVRAVKPK